MDRQCSNTVLVAPVDKAGGQGHELAGGGPGLHHTWGAQLLVWHAASPFWHANGPALHAGSPSGALSGPQLP